MGSNSPAELTATRLHSCSSSCPSSRSLEPPTTMTGPTLVVSTITTATGRRDTPGATRDTLSLRTTAYVDLLIGTTTTETATTGITDTTGTGTLADTTTR